MKEKKRKNIVIYWLLMIALFVVVLLAQQLVASIMQGSLSTSKFGSEATFEILWAGLVLIVVLLFKNKYIFTQKRLGFFESIPYILPELLLSGFFVLISIIGIIGNDSPLDIYAVFNLVLYCLFVGIVEEFLCRGWLLNEFLERYSNNKKEILLSILFSSLIFGVVHFINIGETQGVFETLVQVMNAAASGIFLALVYYKTKNIWIVVASHAIWDFSLFLSQANSLGDCLSAAPTTMSVIANVIRGIIVSGAYLIFCYWLYRQTDLYEKEVKDTKDYLIAIGIVIYIVGLFSSAFFASDDTLCPDFQSKAIKGQYQVSYYNYYKYKVEDTDLILEMDEETGKLWMKNEKTEETVYLTDNDRYRDYLLVDNHNYFSIMIQTSRNVILYGTYSKYDIDNVDTFNKMKDQLEKYAVPDIASLGVLEIEDDSYHYPLLVSNIGEQLYFSEKDKLYINQG